MGQMKKKNEKKCICVNKKSEKVKKEIIFKSFRKGQMWEDENWKLLATLLHQQALSQKKKKNMKIFGID